MIYLFALDLEWSFRYASDVELLHTQEQAKNAAIGLWEKWVEQQQQKSPYEDDGAEDGGSPRDSAGNGASLTGVSWTSLQSVRVSEIINGTTFYLQRLDSGEGAPNMDLREVNEVMAVFTSVRLPYGLF